jgi:formylglycine-generating enzyme required for sulfatase activity
MEDLQIGKSTTCKLVLVPGSERVEFGFEKVDPSYSVEFLLVLIAMVGAVCLVRRIQKRQKYQVFLLELVSMSICIGTFMLSATRIFNKKRAAKSQISAQDELSTGVVQTSGRHVSRISAFFVGSHEITQQQYMEVMHENPSFEKSNNYPVTNVTHDNAAEFCKKLSALNKRSVRLPTEDEWEYMCKLGGVSERQMLDEKSRDNFTLHAWIRSNSNGHLHNVGELQPNKLGMYDVIGNAAELCISQQYLDSGFDSIARGGSFESDWREANHLIRRTGSHGAKQRDVGFRVVVECERITGTCTKLLAKSTGDRE